MFLGALMSLSIIYLAWPNQRNWSQYAVQFLLSNSPDFNVGSFFSSRYTFCHVMLPASCGWMSTATVQHCIIHWFIKSGSTFVIITLEKLVWFLGVRLSNETEWRNRCKCMVVKSELWFTWDGSANTNSEQCYYCFVYFFAQTYVYLLYIVCYNQVFTSNIFN